MPTIMSVDMKPHIRRFNFCPFFWEESPPSDRLCLLSPCLWLSPRTVTFARGSSKNNNLSVRSKTIQHERNWVSQLTLAILPITDWRHEGGTVIPTTDVSVIYHTAPIVSRFAYFPLDQFA
jgi:hypothetical protein